MTQSTRNAWGVSLNMEELFRYVVKFTKNWGLCNGP